MALAVKLFHHFTSLLEIAMEDNWQKSYQTEIEIYDALSCSEDKCNRVFECLEMLYDFKDKDVLEIGCGSGRYTPLLAQKSRRYWALDVSEPLLKLAHKKCEDIENITWLHCSAEQIPLPNESVDAVFASWVLTAMPSDSMREAVDQEVMRVLRPGGIIWLFENAGGDEFVDRLWGDREGTRVMTRYLMAELNYWPVEVVETRFAFADADTAKKVFGFLLGDHAVEYLTNNPKSEIQHRVLILRKQKSV
jgi:ubiquinone/menaquinone biosynthesis C-methylase UbiE